MTLAERLTQMLSGPDGGAALMEGDDQWRERAGSSVLTRAAGVLVAFVDRPHPTILLTRRPDYMRKHSGQVAFPGGGADADDADIVQTALREAMEEVALAPHHVQIIGTVPPYYTGTGYQVTPVLAVIPPDLPLVPDPVEVAHVFEVRVDHLFDPAMQQRQSVMWQGAEREYYEIMADGERIWGATAGMIRNIGALLGLEAQPRALNRDVAWEALR